MSVVKEAAGYYGIYLIAKILAWPITIAVLLTIYTNWDFLIGHPIGWLFLLVGFGGALSLTAWTACKLLNGASWYANWVSKDDVNEINQNWNRKAMTFNAIVAFVAILWWSGSILWSLPVLLCSHSLRTACWSARLYVFMGMIATWNLHPESPWYGFKWCLLITFSLMVIKFIRDIINPSRYTIAPQ